LLRKRKTDGFDQPLPRAIDIPRHMKVRTLADVRAFLLLLKDEQQAFVTWQHVAGTLLQATKDGSTADVSVALR
jgi:hypothetical protein